MSADCHVSSHSTFKQTVRTNRTRDKMIELRTLLGRSNWSKPIGSSSAAGFASCRSLTNRSVDGLRANVNGAVVPNLMNHKGRRVRFARGRTGVGFARRGDVFVVIGGEGVGDEGEEHHKAQFPLSRVG